MAAEQVKEQHFIELKKFLETSFYQPDIEAVKICLCAYAAHTYLKEDPVWLFVIGPPGSGKTSIAIRCLSFLPNTHSISDLTVHSFSSGFGVGNGILGMLTRVNEGKGVLLFPDFTSIIVKDERQLKEIVGQMRQIYDGKFSSWTGNKSETNDWKGKVTCVAAVTGAIEEHWSVNRSLGERFLYLRWKTGDIRKMLEIAGDQIGQREEIHNEFERLVLQYVDTDSLSGAILTKDVRRAIGANATLVSRLRTVIKRESFKRTVVSIDDAEMPNRISNALCLIALGSASLDRRLVTDSRDAFLAARLAYDSIPKNRIKIIESLFDSTASTLDSRDLERKSLKNGVARTSFIRALEDLELLEIINITPGINNEWISLTPEVTELWEEALVVEIDKDLI